MKFRTKIGTASSPDGTKLELVEHDGDHEITVDGQSLMSSRKHESEEELARLACVDLPPKAKVLIGGLGIGFTLRAALDLLPENGQALQVELVPEIVEWNRGPIGHHAGNPLDDPRVLLVKGDVTNAIKRNHGALSAIMLDIDNGPTPLVSNRNSRLYSVPGVHAIRHALKPGGRVAIWCAQDEPWFVERLRTHGFEAESHKTHARPNRKGTPYFILVGRKL